MRADCPTNLRIVEVPCTGRVDILHILEAFERGADGVFVIGCLEGECHYLEGNLRAKKRVTYVKDILKSLGIEEERLDMYNLSSAMGQQFAMITAEVTEKIKELGPSPVKRGMSDEEKPLISDRKS